MSHWFDAQVHLSDILMMLTGVWVFVKTSTQYRDLIRDLGKDVKDMKERMDGVEKQGDSHHEWLIRSGLDRRAIGVKHHEH